MQRVELIDRTGVTVIRCQPERSQELPGLAERLAAGGKLRAVIDLGGISYLSSLQIAAVISLRQGLAARGGRLQLANLSTSLRAVFQVLKLDRLFRLDLDLDAAVADAAR
ncbi:MAG: hypothetical protein RLZZ127_906 [Planctomycetota bacterium]